MEINLEKSILCEINVKQELISKVAAILRMPRLRLELIQRGGGALEKKPLLVKWSIVCSDKMKGGLGVRYLSNLNRALLCKWLWRFSNERNSLWGDVISRKFGLDLGGWCTREVRGGYGVGFWKEIRKEGGCFP